MIQSIINKIVVGVTSNEYNETDYKNILVVTEEGDILLNGMSLSSNITSLEIKKLEADINNKLYNLAFKMQDANMIKPGFSVGSIDTGTKNKPKNITGPQGIIISSTPIDSARYTNGLQICISLNLQTGPYIAFRLIYNNMEYNPNNTSPYILPYTFGEWIDLNTQAPQTRGLNKVVEYDLSQDDKNKINIESLNNDGTINYIKYNLKDNKDEIRYGVLASELEKTHPELVKTNDGNKQVNYIDLLILENVKLKDRLSKLEERIK